MAATRGRVGVWVVAAGLLVGLPGVPPLHAADYVVDGFRLGDAAASGENYDAYNCYTSYEYGGVVECEREEKKAGQAGDLFVTSTLLHTDAGRTIFAEVHAAPVKLSRRTLEKELDALSKAIGAQPTAVDWSPDTSGQLTAVVATWGGTRLHPPDDALDDYPLHGFLVDLLGDPEMSETYSLPVYSVSGGPGYVYAASFGPDGIGDRHYVAVDPETLESRRDSAMLADLFRAEEPLSIDLYHTMLRAFLREDRTRAADDYGLWPDVALATRKLALDTSPDIANRELDAALDEAGSDKLRSKVWSLLPSGTIRRLGRGSYWRYDAYGPRTQYPEIRAAAQAFIADHPDDKFVDFAYFLLGDFDGALTANPNSIIHDVLHFAAGFAATKELVETSLRNIKSQSNQVLSEEEAQRLAYVLGGDPEDTDPYSEDARDFEGVLGYLNDGPELLSGKAISSFVPDFADRSRAPLAQFAAVAGSPLHDDAAYMSAWLALEGRDSIAALAFLDGGLTAGDEADYFRTILRQAIVVLDGLPREQQFTALLANARLSAQSAVWYGLARAAYRRFDYARAIEVAEEGLRQLGLSIEQLPATTDPKKLDEAILRIDPHLADANTLELPYLVEASREIAAYEDDLANIAAQEPRAFSAWARDLVVKYSKLLDAPPESEQAGDDDLVQHRDLRQALHLIETTLEHIRGNATFDALGEWLHYRRVRILAASEPDLTADAVAQMAQDFPASQLLDDALAEQIWADGVERNDVDAAQVAFDELLRRAPNGNAVDNAYNWMQIALCQAGRFDEAERMNNDIIRLFPLTRHAVNAFSRMPYLDQCRPY